MNIIHVDYSNAYQDLESADSLPTHESFHHRASLCMSAELSMLRKLDNIEYTHYGLSSFVRSEASE